MAGTFVVTSGGDVTDALAERRAASPGNTLGMQVVTERDAWGREESRCQSILVAIHACTRPGADPRVGSHRLSCFTPLSGGIAAEPRKLIVDEPITCTKCEDVSTDADTGH